MEGNYILSPSASYVSFKMCSEDKVWDKNSLIQEKKKKKNVLFCFVFVVAEHRGSDDRVINLALFEKN